VRVLVTGATGFVGQHVCQVLSTAGHSIMGTTRESDKLSRYPGSDMCTYRMGEPLPEAMAEFEPDALAHLAWEGIPDFGRERCLKNQSDQESFFGSILMMPTLRRVVVAGTCREYGDLIGRSPGTVEVSPVDEFGRAKDALHRMLRLACGESQVDLTWFRIFYVYGPGQRRESLIPSLLHQLGSGQVPRIKNPDDAHDFVYVGDVATAFRLAVESTGGPEVADLGSGDLHQVQEVLEATSVGSDLTSQQAEERSRAPVGGIWANLDAAQDGLGWQPTTSLVEGIGLTRVAIVGSQTPGIC